MFAVIFEVQPKPDRWQDYLDLARELRPELEKVEGFIDNERFRALRTEGRGPSLSTWADEKALIRWCTHAGHHGVQEKGRFAVFQDYHLRVGEIIADLHVPAETPLPEQRFDTTAVGAAKIVTISELDPSTTDPSTIDPVAADPAAVERGDALAGQLAVPAVGHDGVVAAEPFASITNPGKTLLLVSWRTADAANSWMPPALLVGGGRLRHRRVRVIRDYSLGDRREAPQYYPPVR